MLSNIDYLYDAAQALEQLTGFSATPESKKSIIQIDGHPLYVETKKYSFILEDKKKSQKKSNIFKVVFTILWTRLVVLSVLNRNFVSRWLYKYLANKTHGKRKNIWI